MKPAGPACIEAMSETEEAKERKGMQAGTELSRGLGFLRPLEELEDESPC